MLKLGTNFVVLCLTRSGNPASKNKGKITWQLIHGFR